MADPTTETSASNMSLKRLAGRAKTHGPEFEFKLAALLALRAQKKGLEYQLFTNVEALPLWDDVVLIIRGEQPVIYLFQLKYAEKKEKHVSMQQWLEKTGDFSLKEFFEKFKDIYYKNNLEKQNERDKLVLDRWNMEDLRLVVFTKKIVNKKYFLPERDPAINFPHGDLFETGDKSNTFSFNIEDEKVWDLINDDDDYKGKFLPRLRVFGSQANVGELDGLIEKEIKEMFGNPLPRVKEYAEQYIKAFKDWAESRRCSPITHSTRVLEKILAEDLRKRARDAAGNGVLKFKDEHCERLRNKIHQFDRFLYQVEVPAGHRVAKVQQVLDEKFPGSTLYTWLYVDYQVFHNLSVSALTAASNVCDVIVVDVHRVPSQVKEFLINVKNMEKKIIVLSSESAKNSEVLRGIVQFESTLEEDWRMKDLTEEAQNKFMQKTLELQDTLVPLCALEGAWGYQRLREDVDGQLLSALLRGDATLGEAPAPPPDAADDACALRVPRTLVHHSVLRREALVRWRGTRQHFVLWGFSREELTKLRSEREAEEKRRQQSNEMQAWMQQGTWEERFTEIPDGSECTEERALSHFNLKCSEEDGKNVHLVQNANGILLWRATHGSTYTVAKFVKRLSETCKRPYRCSCFHEESLMDAGEICKDRNRPYLLLGEPGIGKSSYLYNLSLKKRKNDPEHWSVMIRLLDHLELIEKLPEPGDMVFDDVERLIAAAAVAATPCAAAARRFLSAALLETGRVNLFVDGVDEVIPNFKDKALKLLQLLVQHKKKDTLLWIASRPGVDESLSQRLNCNSVSLQPLSYEEQLNYLKSKWKFHEEGFLENAFNILVEELVNAFRITPDAERPQNLKQQNDDLNQSLLAVPLNLRMAADAFSEEARKALKNKSSLLKGHVSRLHLIQHFIEGQRSRFRTRYDVYSSKNKITGSRPVGEDVFELLHQNYAMLAWTSSTAQQSKQQFEETVKPYQEHISREKSGILWKLEDGRVQFVHYVFVEYYVAKWISENFNKSHNTEKFILAALEQRSYSVVSLFVDLMLAENLPLHNAIINGENMDESLLSKNKDVIDRGGRSALHLAAAYGRTGDVNALLDAGCDATKCDTLLSKSPLQYADTTLQLEVIEIFLQRKFHAEELMSIQGVCLDHFLLRRVVTKDLVEVMKRILETLEGKIYLQDLENFDYNLFEKNNEKFRDETKQKHTANVPRRRNVPWSDPLLHIAVASGAIHVTTLLLSKGFNVDCLDKLNQTPLYEACRINRKDIVMTLVQHGANVKHRDDLRTTPLHAAALGGNGHIVKIVLEPIPEGDVFEFVEMKDIDERTPLHYAALTGHTEVVKLLIDIGANVDRRTDTGETPIHLAANNGHERTTEYLLSQGAHIDSVNILNATPLHGASQKDHLETVKLLLSHGANINCRTNTGEQPIHLAALNGHERTAEYLLSQDVDIHSVNNQHATPLHFASQEGHLGTVKLLLSCGANINCRTDTGEQPIHLAALNGHERTAEYLLSQGANIHSVNNQNRTPLHCASQKGNLETVKLLVSRGADVNCRADNGDTPIHLAALNGHERPTEYLFNKGAEIHSVDYQELTPLHNASQKGHLETVKLLLSRGADINCRNKTGGPIHNATFGGHKSTTEYLLSQGADIHSVNNQNVTPLHCASQNGHQGTVKLLVSRGADVNYRADNGDTPIHLAALNGHERTTEYLLNQGADIRSVNNQNATPLHCASKKGHLETVKLLLSRGADVNSRADGKITPIHLASFKGHFLVAVVLLLAGADVNTCDVNGESPLHLAARMGHAPVVRLLLSHDADMYQLNVNGFVPLQLALERGHDDVIAIILEECFREAH